MVVDELLRDLAAAGVAPDDLQVMDRPGSQGREGALFLAEDGDRWLLGCLDRGRMIVSSAWPDEDTACTEAYGRLTAPLLPPRRLGTGEQLRADELAAGFEAAAPAGAPQSVELPPGLLVDRFGALHGRWLFPAGTPFAQRSLPPNLLDPVRPQVGRRVFLVVEPVEVLAGRVAPWFGQPGGGLRLDLVGEDDVWTQVRRDVLREIILP